MELMVAMVIIGILGAVVVPLMRPDSPRVVREKFIAQLAALVGFAAQNAIITGKTNNITFNIERKKVGVYVGRDGGKVPLASAYTLSSIKIPDQLQVMNFYIEGNDELGRYGSGGDVWFYVLPEGFAQPVIINLLDTKDKIGRRNRRFSLVLNPFSAQFEVYSEFKNP